MEDRRVVSVTARGPGGLATQPQRRLDSEGGMSGGYWTNESVLKFAGTQDPIAAVEDAAQAAVFDAVQEGWQGPPFDPFELAEIRGIEVTPRNELREARTVPLGKGRFAIEYNPARPRHRIRFSIAHEIAHTLFADAAKMIRYRDNPGEGPVDAWQLEMLCNVAAAEMLMPTELLDGLGEKPLAIEELIAMRQTFEVSSEVLLRRATKIASYPVAMFAASRVDPDSADSEFRIDYTVPSLAWSPGIRRGKRRPSGSVFSECTAVGFTARRDEDWSSSLQGVAVEAVGTPPYPGQRYPRVLGWLHPRDQRARASVNEPEFLHGDATDPRGAGERLIVHIVNDRTPNWGGGFAGALSRRHPTSQEQFREWAMTDPAHLTLGAVQVTPLGGGISVASVVAQKGYGPSRKPRIRYQAVREGLKRVAREAERTGASLHMPRIGSGQAGGRWDLIREIVDETLTRHGLRVTVYVPSDEPIAEESGPFTALRFDV